ncbi:hypothetical protein Bca52824_000663 [Brassica carinata]|uniref:FKB95-like N-terminal Kelch domain-containing protein n=1 Tax=Brassica carinata TaxID=52824 RepID=A0A8X8BCJ3_BRACI|nr:hypothetical protein Bca52824_000663 [Brassica carinata]
MRNTQRCSASVEGKVYIVEINETSVYNPREGEVERMVHNHMVSHTLTEGGIKDMFADMPHLVCVVEDVLFAFFSETGLMWFDTKLKMWRRLLDRDGKRLTELSTFTLKALAEHDGKLVVLYLFGIFEMGFNERVQCELVSLHRAGDRICGTVDWSGATGTVPSSFHFLHCVAVSS